MKFEKPWIMYGVAVLFAVLTLLQLPSCQSSRSAEEARAWWADEIASLETRLDQANQSVGDLRQSLAYYQQMLAQYPDNKEFADALENIATELAKAQQFKASIDGQLMTSRQRLAEIPEDATGSQIDWQMTGGAVQGVGTLLPPPWNVIAGIAGTVIAGIGGIGWQRAEKTTKAVVNGIDAAKAADETGTLKQGLKKTAPVLEAAMGPVALAKVKKIRSANGTL